MEEHAEAVEDGADVQAVRDEADRDDPPAVEDPRTMRLAASAPWATGSPIAI
jgi:hypothetical protein